MPSLILSIDHVCVASRTKTRLSIEKLEIFSGDSIAIIGPNGAGKTTLLECMAGMLHPSSGSVILNGSAIETLSFRERASHLSYLPQATPPLFDFSVPEFLEMGFYGHSPRSLSYDDRIVRMRKELSFYDAEGLYHRSLCTLSAGEYQRVRMARLALGGRPLWLLDEPTANLDPRYKSMLFERCVRHQEGGGAFIAVVHDLSLVERYFRKVIMLKSGKVFSCGLVDESITSEKLSILYDVKMMRGEGWVYPDLSR